MKINNPLSKFQINDDCIFLNLNTLKLCKGHVVSIATYQNKQFTNVVYTIQRDKFDDNGMPIIITNVPEPCCFHNQTEVYDWAIDVANQKID